MPWGVETLNQTVDKELEALPADLRARFVRVIQLIEDSGLPKAPSRELKLACERAKELEE